jgi:hypothetical protein
MQPMGFDLAPDFNRSRKIYPGVAAAGARVLHGYAYPRRLHLTKYLRHRLL